MRTPMEQYELPVIGKERTNRDEYVESLALKHENRVTKLQSKQERLNARLMRLAARAESRKATAAKVRRIVSVRSGVALDAHVSVWTGIMFTLAYQSVNVETYSALIGGVR